TGSSGRSIPTAWRVPRCACCLPPPATVEADTSVKVKKALVSELAPGTRPSPAGRPPACPAPAAEGEEEDPKQRPREEAAGKDGKQDDAGHNDHQRYQPRSLCWEGGTLAGRLG